MLQYDFNQREGQSKYEYLYQCLKADILNGNIMGGSKLPSKRELASANKISIKTVMNAYEQLLMEGYIISKERSGYYVVSDFTPQLRYQNIPVHLPTAEVEENWIADFCANTAVYERFPFSMWTKVMRNVLADYNVNLMRRGEFLGSQELRLEIAKHLYHSRSIIVSPDCIVIGTGIEYLYSKIIELLPKNSIYGVENPGYRKIPHIYEEYGVEWTWSAMDREGILMSSLQSSRASVLHVSPEHHYPLGTVMSAKRRQQLLKWLEDDPNRYIIEDDYDCEFRYRGRPISALYGLDYTHRVIYMNTFSKTLSPAIRISYMVLPEKLLNQYVSSANFFSNTSSNLEQYTLARFIKEGYFCRHLNRMRKYYQNQGEMMLKILRNTKTIPIEGISGVESGTHLLVQVNTKMTDEEIKWKARQKGINLSCLSEFCIGNPKQYQHVLVLNYLNMEEEKIKEAIDQLGEVFQ